MKKLIKGPIIRADILSVLSLIISTSVAILAFYQYFQNQSEALSITIRPHTGQGYVKVTDFSDIEGNDKVIQVPWQVIISNTGERKVSVIECNIQKVSKHNTKTYDYKNGLYGGILGEIISSAGGKIEFPLTVDVGESYILNVYVGILIDQEIYQILYQDFPNKSFSLGDMIKALGARHYDIYGNNAKLYEIDDEEFYLDVDPDNKRLPLFLFEFISGRNNRFGTFASMSF